MDTLLSVLQDFIGNGGSIAMLFIALAAAAVFALTMGLSGLVAGLLDPVRRRLGQLGSAQHDAGSTAAALADNLSKFADLVAPRSERERVRVDRLLMHAGYRSANARTLYYGIKALAVLTLPTAVLLVSPMFPKLTTNQLMLYAAAAGYLGWISCSMWLDRQVAKRQRAIRAGFPDALDLLVVCVESGLWDPLESTCRHASLSIL